MDSNLRTITSIRITDLGLAAALISCGCKLSHLDKSNLKKVVFHFQEEGEINQIVEDYWSDSLQVNPRVYFDDIKMLKNRLYNS